MASAEKAMQDTMAVPPGTAVEDAEKVRRCVLDLHWTAKALAEYRRTEPERTKLFDAADTTEKVDVWKRAEQEALNKVREAFYLDTMDRNSHENCMLVGIGWLSELVKRYGPLEGR